MNLSGIRHVSKVCCVQACSRSLWMLSFISVNLPHETKILLCTDLVGVTLDICLSLRRHSSSSKQQVIQTLFHSMTFTIAVSPCLGSPAAGGGGGRPLGVSLRLALIRLTPPAPKASNPDQSLVLKDVGGRTTCCGEATLTHAPPDFAPHC